MTKQTVLHSLGGVVKAGTSFLTDLLDRLVTGIQGLAPLAFALGCQAGDAAGVSPPPSASVAKVTEAVVVEDTGPRDLGKFNITFYYVIGEDEVVAKPVRKKPPANDNGPVLVPSTDPVTADGANAGETELAAVAAIEMVTLYSGTCEPIAEVSKEFSAQLALQGTGKLKDGRVLNVWGSCNCPRSPCFKPVVQQWGTAGTGRPLQPFRTVAVDPKVVKLGSLLYIPLLEGRQMPGRSPWGGFVHDGCVIADDVGGGIRGKQIDLFVGRKGWFLGMSGKGSSHAWARQVPVFDGAKLCERKGRKIARKAGSI